ncbi:hypothetical protein [Streptomyces sp. CA-132043]|uniref:hypothetical protein n=1 Tax=Streptomyces sp. CA-132043 TaxID=3240048 RepID=UPI003D8DFA25
MDLRHGGWFLNVSGVAREGSWSFPVYVGAMTAVIGLYLLGLRAAATAEGRRQLDGGSWLAGTPLAVLVLSHYGEFGPLDQPPLPGAYDLLALLALALACYAWAVRSGFRTQQLERAVPEDYAEAQEPPVRHRTGSARGR